MTLSKLARLANVSVAVVSKAFSGKDGVSDAMLEHVFSVARENGCFEQFFHAPYDRPVVAVIIPEAISKYYIGFVDILKKSMDEYGYTMLVSISNFDMQMMEELLRYYTDYGKVNGIVAFGRISKMNGNTDAAVVTVSENCSDYGNVINIDISVGMRQCVRYLSAHGHRRIAYVGEPLVESKRKMLEIIMREEGLEVSDELMICSRKRFEEAGTDGAHKLMSMKNKPTAVICGYGYIAGGFIKETEKNGFSVPNDVSVIALGDDHMQIHENLDVSCIPSDVENICEKIMMILKEKMNTASPNEHTVTNIPTFFYVGETVADVLEQ